MQTTAMARRSVRRLAYLAVVPGLAVGVAACGETGGGQSQVQQQAPDSGAVRAVQAAYAETTSASTAKIEMSMSSSMNGRQMKMSGHGKIDFANNNSAMTFSLPDGKTFESRRIGDTAYAKLPEGARPSDKPWVKIDLEKMAKGLGMSASPLPGGNDPTQMLGYLRGVSDSVSKEGTETVRGQQATRYEATIDLDKVAADAGEGAREAMDAFQQAIGTDTVTATVWVDEQDRIVRYRTTIPSAGGSGRKGKTTMTMELYDYGAPVEVSAPPKNKTTTLGAKP